MWRETGGAWMNLPASNGNMGHDAGKGRPAPPTLSHSTWETTMHLHRNWALALTIAAIWTLSVTGLRAEDYKVVTEKNVQYGTASGEKLLLDLAKPEGLKSRRRRSFSFTAAAGRQATRRATITRSSRWRLVATWRSRSNIVSRPSTIFPPRSRTANVRCAVAGACQRPQSRSRSNWWLGDSAGGHLVLMLGTMDPKDGLEGDGGWSDQSSKVQAVVSYYGPTNFLDEYPAKSKDIVANFIGGSLADKKDEYRRASPITYVNEGDAPTLMFQGTVDDLVPYNQAEQMATALTNAHVPGRVELILGSGHGFGGAEGERIYKDATDFLDQQLRKKK